MAAEVGELVPGPRPKGRAPPRPQRPGALRVDVRSAPCRLRRTLEPFPNGPMRKTFDPRGAPPRDTDVGPSRRVTSSIAHRFAGGIGVSCVTAHHSRLRAEPPALRATPTWARRAG